MKDYTTISRVYFIGIGGIGMSALARYYLNKNVIVSGYDKTPTQLSIQMESEGIAIHYEDNVALLDKEADLVVYTPAIPKDHKEFNYYKAHQYEIAKRSDVLQQITQSTFNICIAGTHGKTTISTMVAHILRHSGFGCNAFLGGISGNYGTNFWGSGNNVSVVEADEYDRSFLKLSPDIALISAMDADHLDIYGTKENMEDAFVEFARQVKAKGLLLTKFGLPEKDFIANSHICYSLQNSTADVYASGITMHNGSYEFDVMTKDWMLGNVRLNMGGMHNVENVVAAIFIAHYLKIDPDKIRNAVSAFKGVKRRFEYIISPSEAVKEENNVVYIDDYAHHPAELNALIRSAKSLFNNRKCTVIFQPHLFSRTKDFAKEFAESLDMADEIFLLPVYPARELPMEGVSSELILAKMENKNASVVTKEELLKYLSKNYLQSVKESINGQVLITAGAGNIDQLVLPIQEIILNTI
jgi:UDP-N-acetylmuramate--alanine ligase